MRARAAVAAGLGMGAVAMVAAMAPRQPDDPAALAGHFLAQLDAAQRTGARYSFAVPERRRWGRSPARRTGARLGDLPPAARDAAWRLVATVLSPAGLDAARGIVAEQDLLAPEAGIGSGFYWLAVYGEPGVGAWGWRLGGHHLSVHVTYEGQREVGFTPLLLGTERPTAPGSFQLAREAAVRALLARLDSAHRGVAIIAADVADSLELMPQRPSRTDVVGVSGTVLDAAAREALLHVLALHAATLRADLAGDLIRRARASAPAQLSFAWAGSERAGEAHWYRIAAGDVVLTTINHGSHLHTLLNTGNDFGER